MRHKSLQIIKQLSNPQQDGPKADFQVIEPGPNPPTVTEIAQRMVAKITTNADQMLDALILLAKGGHFQAAEYLLTEMHRLALVLKDVDKKSLSDRLAPIVARMEAEYHKRQAITIVAESLPDTPPSA